MVRIWFNHWFSAVYNIIAMMREGCGEELHVIGSNRNETAVYRSMCDEWHREPDDMGEEAYADFCLDFCRENRVDVFVPRRGLAAVLRRADSFAELGVKLFNDVDAAMADVLDDKLAAYRFFTDRGFDCIPEVRVATSTETFRAAYEELIARYPRVCYKLSVDEGARSFRVIDGRIREKRALLEKPGFKICLDDALTVLAQYDFAVPVLVMPYLDGPEISIDCMRTPQGDLIIPRRKTAGRYSIVSFDPDVMQLCSRLMDAVGAAMPMNVQLRMHEGRMWLLEINPRMSGGLQLSCAASGINLPAVALGRLLGKSIPWAYPDIESRRVAHVERAVCFD